MTSFKLSMLEKKFFYNRISLGNIAVLKISRGRLSSFLEIVIDIERCHLSFMIFIEFITLAFLQMYFKNAFPKYLYLRIFFSCIPSIYIENNRYYFYPILRNVPTIGHLFDVTWAISQLCNLRTLRSDFFREHVLAIRSCNVGH